MGKIFAVTSGKGGVGKSSLAVGLGFAFASLSKKVLLVDMDEGLRCLDLMLGIDNKAIFDLSDALNGNDASDSIYEYSDNLYLVPAPLKPGMITAASLAKFALCANGMFDVVIFDFPAGFNVEYYKSLPCDTMFLTVATEDPVSVRDASVVATYLCEINADSRLVINKFNYKKSLKTGYKNIDEIIDFSSLRLVGIIPESDEVRLLSLNHKLKQKGKAQTAFLRIAKRLLGENVPLPDLRKI